MAIVPGKGGILKRTDGSEKIKGPKAKKLEKVKTSGKMKRKTGKDGDGKQLPASPKKTEKRKSVSFSLPTEDQGNAAAAAAPQSLPQKRKSAGPDAKPVKKLKVADSGASKPKPAKKQFGKDKKGRRGGAAADRGKIQHQQGRPDWKQVRKDAARIRNARKSHNKLFGVGQKMKQLWEELRVEKCPEERRRQLIAQLTPLVTGNVAQLLRAHDRARVCETLFELGGPELRAQLFSEVRHQLVDLCRDKYARHFVLKVLTYGSTEQKDAVGAAFRGRLPTLMAQKFASEVAESYFRDCASPEARQRMLMEFYGAEFLLLTSSPRDLAQLIQEQPGKRQIYLTNLRSQLQVLMDKQLLAGSLSHRLLNEYLSLCPEADRSDLIQSLRETLVQMVHTRDGARVAMLCLWWGTTKDRKAIVKSFKTYVAKICMDERGFLVMLALMDVVDDTRLVKKALLDEMMSNIGDIVADEHGRKVVHYLLSPRDSRYFHPELICTLTEGDGNPTSKKEAEVRRRELLEGVSEPLLRTASLHCLQWSRDSSLCVLLTHILTRCTGDTLKLPLAQLARQAARPAHSDTADSLINNSAAYMQLKKLIQADKQRAAVGTPANVLFSTLLLSELSEEVLQTWLTNNRAAFLLVIMLETEVPAVLEHVIQRLTPHKNKLKPTCKGAQILKQKLTEQKQKQQKLT